MSMVWLNGELVAADEAFVPALDRGVLWGYGLFETLRIYDGCLWAFDEHYARLLDGADVIGITPPEPEELRRDMLDVAAANGVADGGVRATLTAGSGPPEPHADPDRPPNLLVTAWPLPDYTDLYANGVALVTMDGGGRPLANVKTTSYAASVVGRVLAQRSGADDALFVGSGLALEATGSNLFCARGSRLATPPVSDRLLPGVTRAYVVDVARECGFDVEERSVSVDELFEADDIVLTSSLREVYPVRSVDERDVKRGDVAERLREAYHASVLRSLDAG
jgi:branched-subunit amino acid aminotransferase/4-amino-4-deoxychorismate lyase